jgi:hypothetical protein
MKKGMLQGTCASCKKWRTPGCEFRKYNGTDGGPNDWCRGHRASMNFLMAENTRQMFKAVGEVTEGGR